MSNASIVVLAGASAASFLVWGLIGVSIGSLLPEIVKTFTLTPTEAGTIFVSWSLGFSIGSLIARRVLASAEPALVLAIGSALACTTCVLQVKAESFAAFLAGFLALGLIGGAVFTASHTLYGDVFPKRRASALAILDVVFSLGTLSAPLAIVSIARGGLPWQAFFAVAGCGFAMVTGLFTWQATFASAPSHAASAMREKPEDGDRAGVAAWVPLACASFALGATEWTQNVWFVTFAIDRGFSDEGANLALSCFTAGMILSRLSVIAIRQHRSSGRFAACLFLAATMGALVTSFAPSGGMTIVGNALLGLGTGALFPTFLGRAMDCNPRSAATCSTIMIVSLTLGGQAASFGMGVAAEQLGMHSAFPLMILFVGVAVVGFETYRRSTRESS